MKLQNCQREISYEAQARDRFSKELDTATFIGHVGCVMLYVSYLLCIIQVFNCKWIEHMDKKKSLIYCSHSTL